MSITLGTPLLVASATSVGATLSGSFDAGSGSNRILVVFGFHERDGAGSQNISGLTFNSVALTNSIKNPGTGSANTTEEAEVWYLIDPASGSNTLEASYDATGQDALLIAVTLQGSVGALSIGDTDFGSAADTANATLSLTIDAGAIIAMGMSGELSNSGPFTPDSGTVEGLDGSIGGNNAGIAYFFGSREEASGGTYAVGATTTGTGSPRDVTISAVEVQEAAGAGFVPYPNPRYSSDGGMQNMNGGV